MSDFVKVAKVGEIPEGSMKAVEYAGEEVIIANVGGSFYAMGGICTHREWSLIEGTLQGDKVVCAGHGAIWDLKTGKAEFPVPLKPQRLYEVKVEGEDILIRPQ